MRASLLQDAELNRAYQKLVAAVAAPSTTLEIGITLRVTCGTDWRGPCVFLHGP
jgi:hypothetical protein